MKPNPTSSLLLTVKEVAEMIGVSSRTVWRMRSSGELVPPIHVRGSIRWRRDEIERWIANGCPHHDQNER